MHPQSALSLELAIEKAAAATIGPSASVSVSFIGLYVAAGSDDGTGIGAAASMPIAELA